MNVVILCYARLVHRWVTVFGRVNHLARNQAPRPILRLSLPRLE